MLTTIGVSIVCCSLCVSIILVSFLICMFVRAEPYNTPYLVSAHDQLEGNLEKENKICGNTFLEIAADLIDTI